MSGLGSMRSCYLRWLDILCSSWLFSWSANMPWPAIDQDLFEYVSSQMAILTVMSAEMNGA